MNIAPSSASYLQMRSNRDRSECEHAMRRLWEYLDDELALAEANVIGQHVLGCERCYAAMMSARRMLSAVASSRWAIRAPAALRDRVTRLRHRVPRGD